MRRLMLLVAALVAAAAVGLWLRHNAMTVHDFAPPITTTTHIGGITTTSTPARAVTISAVGDTELGNTPDLPSDPDTYLSSVKDALDAQIVFGNLEGTMTNGGSSKCAANATECYAFRVPTSYAEIYRHAGFTVLNAANNHSYDFGSIGAADTTTALHAAGIVQAGLSGEIGLVSAGGMKVAFVDFAPYAYTNDLLNFTTANDLIAKAKSEASLVVVYMHAGAEGSSADHVTKNTEYFDGENRGNAYAFAHNAIDDGADLVIASGPHVLRGMEFYKGHLIDYSMGDFANYGNFALDGDLDLSEILNVSLSTGGSFVTGHFTSVLLEDKGQPFVDPRDASANFVNGLSVNDFGNDAAWIKPNGQIIPYVDR